MRVKHLILVAGFVASFGIVTLATSPAFAREAENEIESTPSTTNATQSTNLDDKKLEAQKKLEEARLEAQKKLQEAKQTVKSKTEAEKQKICQEKSAQITEKINKKNADAVKHKAVFDKIYTRVKEFKVKNNLNVANYDSLVANVDAKAKNAQAAIDALKSIDSSVDCTKTDAAKTKIATYVAALKQAREALKAYRTSIKDLTVAIKTSIGDSAKNETENSSQPTPTPTTERTN